MIAKTFQKVNNLLNKPHEREPTKKRPHINGTIIFKFFDAKNFYKKMMCSINNFQKILLF
jgi:hypothetical protein